MKTIVLFISFCIAGLPSFAQSVKFPVLNIPVQRNNVQMRLPWSGGMDSPEFSYFDFDGDGVPDLFVFDRAGARASVYINTGGIGDTAYRYAPEYETILPQGMVGWAVVRDYNHDGIPDIFTHNAYPPGSRVYKGSRQNGILHFDLVCPLIEYPGTNGFLTNLYTNIEDMPIIMDVNGDGDLDYLTYDLFGTSVYYYENQTEEHAGDNDPYYDIDSFRYLLVENCWGDFTQNAANNSIILNDTQCTGGMAHLVGPPALPPPGNRDSRHTGNSMYAIYPYADSIFAVLNGNIGFETLMFLKDTNNSNVNADMGVWDSLYPPPSCTTPVIIASYPAAYGVHVNGNPNLQDLLVAPYSDYLTGFNINNVWQYNNTGDSNCVYHFEGDTFLAEHMLDFGTDSKPVFYDMNGDSLLDMMIGDYGYFLSESVYKSTIAYYQNTGTATQPKFKKITDDYDSISKFGLVDVTPAFGDLNGDGKPDMVIGEVNGWLHVFLNQGTGGVSSFPTITYPEYFHLRPTGNNPTNSTPFVFDVNGDGLNDLVVGNISGTLSYYWNYGTKDSAIFSMDSSNQHFGAINVTPSDAVYGISQPYITKDSSGNLLLFVGSISGTVAEFVINPDSLRSVVDSFSYLNADTLVHSDSLHYPAFTCINPNFLGRNVGADVFFSAGDITNTGHLNYLIGCEMGGLLMFSDSLYDSINYINSIPLLHINELEIFPNPTHDNFTCTAGNVPFINPQVQVYNVLGEIVPAKISVAADKVMVFTTGLSNGFYLVRISDENQSYTGKVLLQR